MDDVIRMAQINCTFHWKPYCRFKIIWWVSCYSIAVGKIGKIYIVIACKWNAQPMTLQNAQTMTIKKINTVK